MGHLRRLYPYLRRHRRALLAGCFFITLAVSAQLLIPKVIGRALDRLDLGEATGDLILLSAAAVAGFAVVRAVLIFIGRYFVLSSSRRLEEEMRNDLYQHLTTLSARFYDLNATGDITSKAINDVEGVRMMAGPGLQSICSTGITFIGAQIALFLINPGLAGICIVPLVLISVVMVWAGKKVHECSKEVQEQIGVLSSRAQESFSGARVVRAFVQEENEIARFRTESDSYRTRSVRLARWRALAWALILVLWELAIVLTLYVGGRAMLSGVLSIGQFAEFVAYQFMMLWPMIAIGWVINLTQRGLVCLGRLAEIFEAKPETDDAAALRTGEPIRGAIEARGLTFSYDPERAPALLDVSFRVQPGEKVALVGRTGAGKSCLVQLLLRLYRVPDGMLFVDGRDINTIPLAELRGAIGNVPQELFLFSDRIRENIAFGGLNGVADEEVIRAAEISRLSADIEQFPERYEQIIGERGVTLSGGQKQRTALARAIIRGPRILLLDDALSSVDSHTEREIEERLREFMKGRTSIVITHRLSEIADADRIFVLQDGRLVEQGRHDELVAKGGAYAALWESQKLAEELSEA